MTVLPTWAVFLVSFGTPVLTLLGVLLANLITRKGARELETRSRREETMRNLRWAAELAVVEEDRMADLGVAQLVALLESDLLDEAEKVFVEAALGAVYQDPEAELEQWGDDAEAVSEEETDVEPWCMDYPRRQERRTDMTAGAKRVAVSSAQKSAARAMVKRSAVTGRLVSTSVHKIANARPAVKNGVTVPRRSTDT